MRASLLSILLVIPTMALAEDKAWYERIALHGFASQAYIHTTDNHFYGPSDDGSFEFTEVGINGSFRISPKLSVTLRVCTLAESKTKSAYITKLVTSPTPEAPSFFLR